MALVALLLSWILGPFVRCPECGHRGATLRLEPTIGGLRGRWRCRECRHSHTVNLP